MIASVISKLWRSETPFDEARIKVLFVCMGNICRSPTAHGVMLKMLHDAGLSKEVFVESAGTHAYHVGESPDDRSIATAAAHDVDLRPLRARLFIEPDFYKFDYILAMDGTNLRHMLHRRTDSERPVPGRVSRLLDYATADVHLHDVPDPYYGGVAGFDTVYSLVEAGCAGLLEQIKRDLELAPTG